MINIGKSPSADDGDNARLRLETYNLRLHLRRCIQIGGRRETWVDILIDQKQSVLGEIFSTKTE